MELSPDTAAMAKIRSELAKRQHLARAATLGGGAKEPVKWLVEELNAPGAGLASDILVTLGSEDGKPYYPGDTISQRVLDAAIVHARAHASDQVPDTAAEARRWMSAWMNMLKAQAAGEEEAMDKAITLYKPLYMPYSADSSLGGPSGGSRGYDAPRGTASKEATSVVIGRYASVTPTDNYHYFQNEPSERVDDKMIHNLAAVSNGVLLAPKWDDIIKNGRAGSIKSAQEEHASMLNGMLKLFYVRYRMTSSSSTTYGINDEGSAKYIEEHVDVHGATVKTERTWFFDHRALDHISRNIRWPLERIADDAVRLAMCAKIWTALQSACSKIGTRTLTSLIFDLADGPLFREAEDIVNKQALSTPGKARAGTTPSTAPRRAEPATKRDREYTRSHCILLACSAVLSHSVYICKLLYVTGGPDEPPYGQCIAWCRDGKCKKTDATISFDCARYEHKDEHKGKFPSATYPPKRSGRK